MTNHCTHGRPHEEGCPHCLGINDLPSCNHVMIQVDKYTKVCEFCRLTQLTANSKNDCKPIVKESLEDVLDEQFPKGKCKERGAALVLYAYAEMKIKEAYNQGMADEVENCPHTFNKEDALRKMKIAKQIGQDQMR